MAEGDARRPLPHGRHGLAADRVRTHQSRRIERSIAELVAEVGLSRTTVGDVVARARVSRQTFYELYAGLEECYEHAVTAYALELWGQETRMDGAHSWEAFEDALRLGFEALAQDPVFSRCLFLEPPAGLAGLSRQRTTMRTRIHHALQRLTPSADPFPVEAMTAMIRQLIEDHLATDRMDELPGRASAIVAMLEAFALSAVPERLATSDATDPRFHRASAWPERD